MPAPPAAEGQRLRTVSRHLENSAPAATRRQPEAPAAAARWPAGAAAAEPADTVGLLSPEQLAAFERDGFLLASGLMSEEVAAEAERALWDMMGLDPLAADAASWRSLPPAVASQEAAAAAPGAFGSSNQYSEDTGLVVMNGVQQPNIMAAASDDFVGAMAQLLGRRTVPRPQAAHTQHKLPRPDAPRPAPQPHVDGIPKEQMNRVFPGPYIVTALLFLSAVDGTDGGGTAVWPGSHQKIRRLAESVRSPGPPVVQDRLAYASPLKRFPLGVLDHTGPGGVRVPLAADAGRARDRRAGRTGHAGAAARRRLLHAAPVRAQRDAEHEWERPALPAVRCPGLQPWTPAVFR